MISPFLLLNSILTVRSGQPASHKNIGWERFTDTVIDTLNLNKKNLVYLLWGNYAKKKCKALDKENNLVLESPRHYLRANFLETITFQSVINI